MKWGQPAGAGRCRAGGARAGADGGTKSLPIWAADLRLTPNGKFLYTTERNTDKIPMLGLSLQVSTPT